jgi:hypothetical protein
MLGSQEDPSSKEFLRFPAAHGGSELFINQSKLVWTVFWGAAGPGRRHSRGAVPPRSRHQTPVDRPERDPQIANDELDVAVVGSGDVLEREQELTDLSGEWLVGLGEAVEYVPLGGAIAPRQDVR